MRYNAAISLAAPPPRANGERKLPLEMTVTEFGHEAVRLILVGDLDVSGADRLDLPLATLAGAGGHLVVDMTRLDGIASIGIRHLVSAARALCRRRHRLVLLAPSPPVTNTLMSARVDNLLLIVGTEDEARVVLGAV
jgi:anti-sigma B factor antagonist